jgi:O-antigen/teichoic acid export membrane protein
VRASFSERYSVSASGVNLHGRALRALGRARSAPVAGDSALLFANSITGAVFGVAFWTVAAQLYDISAVGLTLAIVAAATLVATFANLGLSAVVVRFMPVAGHRGRLLSLAACLTPGLVALGIMLTIFALPVGHDLVAGLRGDTTQTLLLAAMAVAMSVSFVQDSVFIARRQARLVLFRGVCGIIFRFAALMPMVSYGTVGLVGAYLIGALGVVVLGAGAWKKHPEESIGSVLSLKEMAQYGGTSYLSGLFSQAPQMLYPILIASQVSHAAAGAFAFVWMPVSMLMVLPASVANVLMSQVVRSREHTKHATGRIGYIRQATRALVATMAALSCLLFVGVSLFAQVFVPKSAGDIEAFLPVMLAGSVFFALVRLNSMELAFRARLRALMALNGLSALIAVLLPVALLPHYGVLGLEGGWLASQLFAALLGRAILAKHSTEVAGV